MVVSCHTPQKPTLYGPSQQMLTVSNLMFAVPSADKDAVNGCAEDENS